MSEPERPTVGSIGWVDLTVPNAEEVRDFYREVVGWTAAELDMGGYADFVMSAPADGKAVSGVCHARGANADLPRHWIIYIVVADLEASMRACAERGGQVIAGPREAGGGRYCVIRDPAGAVAALYQAP